MDVLTKDPDKLTAMSKIGFLVGENDKFTKLLKCFLFLFFEGFIQKYFRTIILIDFHPGS